MEIVVTEISPSRYSEHGREEHLDSGMLKAMYIRNAAAEGL
jgi:hypothetical protein